MAALSPTAHVGSPPLLGVQGWQRALLAVQLDLCYCLPHGHTEVLLRLRKAAPPVFFCTRRYDSVPLNRWSIPVTTLISQLSRLANQFLHPMFREDPPCLLYRLRPVFGEDPLKTSSPA